LTRHVGFVLDSAGEFSIGSFQTMMQSNLLDFCHRKLVNAVSRSNVSLITLFLAFCFAIFLRFACMPGDIENGDHAREQDESTVDVLLGIKLVASQLVALLNLS
jgi:hypothetical protein